MALTWYNAVIELCSPSSTKRMLTKQLGPDSAGSENHYTLSTFVLLLASKFCFSVQVLVNALIYKVLVPMCNDEHRGEFRSLPVMADSALHNVEGGCLALRIAAGLVCATAEPFLVKGEEARGRAVSQVRALRLLQITEMDKVIFPLLSAVCILNEAVKEPSKGASSPEKARLCSVAKTALLAMCEEEWVIRRVFWICEAEEKSEKTDSKTRREDPFNCPKLKNNSLVSLRPRSTFPSRASIFCG